jgi:hypothetical protein
MDRLRGKHKRTLVRVIGKYQHFNQTILKQELSKAVTMSVHFLDHLFVESNCKHPFSDLSDKQYIYISILINISRFFSLLSFLI